jgi:hypothetical protein
MEVNSELFVMGILSNDAFVLVNKRLLRYLHGDGSAAVFLGELVSAYKYHLNNQSLDPDNSFPAPIKRFVISLGLSEYKQHRILEQFSTAGLCTVLLKSFPATKYVCLDFDVLARILAVDDMHARKLEKQTFYNEINSAFNSELDHPTADPGPDGPELMKLRETKLDNMSDTLRGSILLISKWYLSHKVPVEWTSERLGKLRTWVNRRALGKPFDFTIITRTTANLPIQKDFGKTLSTFIEAARLTQDIHYNVQVHDYNELLK